MHRPAITPKQRSPGKRTRTSVSTVSTITSISTITTTRTHTAPTPTASTVSTVTTVTTIPPARRGNGGGGLRPGSEGRKPCEAVALRIGKGRRKARREGSSGPARRTARPRVAAVAGAVVIAVVISAVIGVGVGVIGVIGVGVAGVGSSEVVRWRGNPRSDENRVQLHGVKLEVAAVVADFVNDELVKLAELDFEAVSTAIEQKRRVLQIVFRLRVIEKVAVLNKGLGTSLVNEHTDA